MDKLAENRTAQYAKDANDHGTRESLTYLTNSNIYNIGECIVHTHPEITLPATLKMGTLMIRSFLCIGIFLATLTLNAAPSISKSLDIVKSKFATHKSGNIRYERDVFVLRNKSYTDLTDPGKLNSLLTKEPRVISDTVDYYYLNNSDKKKRFFIELKNKLPVFDPKKNSQDLVARAQYSTEKYHKLFIVDEARNQTFFGVYEHGNTNNFINTILMTSDRGLQPDVGLERPVPYIDELLFTPYIHLDIDAYPKQLSATKTGEVTTYWFESNKIRMRLDMNDTLGQATHVGFSDQSLAGKQEYFIEMTEYRDFGGESLPTNIVFKWIYAPNAAPNETANLIKKEGLDNVKLNAVVARIKVTKAQFDTAEIAAKVGFSRVEGKLISDGRFNMESPVVKNYSDAESPAQVKELTRSRDKQRSGNSELGFLTNPLVIGTVIVALLAGFWMRRRA